MRNTNNIFPTVPETSFLIFNQQTTPPVYKIEDVIARTAVWSGAKDTTVNPKNVEQLLPRIKHLVFYKRVPYWGHQDFIWGLNAPELVYSDMLYLMNNYQ